MGMLEPVVAADGTRYERHAIETWLSAHETSPLTGLPLEHKRLVADEKLQKEIRSLYPGLTSPDGKGARGGTDVSCPHCRQWVHRSHIPNGNWCKDAQREAQRQVFEQVEAQNRQVAQQLEAQYRALRAAQTSPRMHRYMYIFDLRGRLLWTTDPSYNG